MSIQKLHYENISGTLVRREGLLSWRCPLCKAEGQSPGVMHTCPECGSKEATLPGAQPAANFADAYQGAMEEVAIWKKRALEAEELNRKFVAEINGPTYTGEPAQPAPSVPREAVEKMLTQLMDIAVSNGANSVSMPDEYVEVAAWLCGIPAQPAPSVNEGVRKVTLGFRWESEAQHHIPTIEIEFDPVSPDSPNDAKGWQDRDRIASMLSPEAKP